MSSPAHVSRPFVQQVLVLVGLAALTVLAVLILWNTFEVFLLVFAGTLLGVFLYSLSALLASRLPLSYRWWLAIVVLVLFGGAAIGLYYMVPQITGRVSQLTQQLDEAVTQLRQQVRQMPWGQQLLNRVPKLGELFSGQSELFAVINNIFRTTFGALVNIVVIFFLGLYTAATPRVYRHGILSLVPPARRDRAAEVLHDVRVTLWRWTLGRLFSMAVIGVATGIGLWLMGIPLPITMAVIAATLTFIPNIGPILSVIPPMLLAFQQSPMMALYVALFYFVLQLAESYLLTPLVQRRQVSLPPALTISVQLLFYVLAGILGLILATPLAAMVLVLVNDLYVRDALHDYNTPLPHERAG